MNHNSTNQGTNLRVCIAHARYIGASIKQVKGTDEIRFSHPLIERSVIIKKTRVSASRALVVWLRRVEERSAPLTHFHQAPNRMAA